MVWDGPIGEDGDVESVGTGSAWATSAMFDDCHNGFPAVQSLLRHLLDGPYCVVIAAAIHFLAS